MAQEVDEQARARRRTYGPQYADKHTLINTLPDPYSMASIWPSGMISDLFAGLSARNIALTLRAFSSYMAMATRSPLRGARRRS